MSRRPNKRGSDYNHYFTEGARDKINLAFGLIVSNNEDHATSWCRAFVFGRFRDVMKNPVTI